MVLCRAMGGYPPPYLYLYDRISLISIHFHCISMNNIQVSIERAILYVIIVSCGGVLNRYNALFKPILYCFSVVHFAKL